MGEDIWAGLADQFVDGAYATVKGHVRTNVMHQHLLEHLPPPPAAVLDVTGLSQDQVNAQKNFDEKAKQALGENPVYLAFRDDAAFIALGDNGVGALKDALAAFHA